MAEPASNPVAPTYERYGLIKIGPFVWHTRRFVGMVEAETCVLDNDGRKVPGSTRQGYWVLTEMTNGRKRRAKSVGDAGQSPYAVQRRAQVSAWLAGGPLPPLSGDAMSAPSSPPAKLIVFPGGKPAA